MNCDCCVKLRCKYDSNVSAVWQVKRQQLVFETTIRLIEWMGNFDVFSFQFNLQARWIWNWQQIHTLRWYVHYIWCLNYNPFTFRCVSLRLIRVLQRSFLRLKSRIKLDCEIESKSWKFGSFTAFIVERVC